MANDPAQRDHYLLGVLREPGGRGGSVEMNDRVKVDDLITVTHPINHFPLSDKAERHLLIAGGIGITPVLAMLQYLEREGAAWHLHYCTRSPEKTAFKAWLEASAFGGKVEFHHDGGDPAKGLDIKGLLAQPEEGTHVYCCGPAGLMRAVKEAGDHWPLGTMHFEHFAVDESELGDQTNAAFEVEVASSGQVVQVPEDESILEALEAVGIEVPHMCTEGLCGTCIVDVLEGEPDHRDFVLDDEEKAENNLIAVCCSRSKSKRLKLDL